MTELFSEDGGRLWGWECVCGDRHRAVFETETEAQRSAVQHAATHNACPHGVDLREECPVCDDAD